MDKLMGLKNRLFYVALALLLSAVLFSCKSKKLTVNDGAEIIAQGDEVEGTTPVEGSTMTKTERGMVLTFQSDVLFDINSSFLTDKAKSTLANMVAYIKRNYPDSKLQIDGHTDATGTPEYNMELSERRAKRVKDYLVERGLKVAEISTKGYGLTKPVAVNNTPEGRQKNRRVEIIILK